MSKLNVSVETGQVQLDDQPARAAGGDRAHIRLAQLDRARLQTDEERVRPGRLYGHKRPGDPPPRKPTRPIRPHNWPIR